MEEDRTKQVIVMRRDLKMRRGKEIAQGSHASMAFLTRRLQKSSLYRGDGTHGKALYGEFSKAERDWMEGSFAKVCVKVTSEEELLDIYEKAKEAGLEVHLITDSGRTEFHGEPTHTCLAIGPDFSSKIDPITGDLVLL